MEAPRQEWRRVSRWARVRFVTLADLPGLAADEDLIAMITAPSGGVWRLLFPLLQRVVRRGVLHAAAEAALAESLPDKRPGMQAREKQAEKTKLGRIRAARSQVEELVSIIAAGYHWGRSSILALTPRQAMFHAAKVRELQYAKISGAAAIQGIKMQGQAPIAPALYAGEKGDGRSGRDKLTAAQAAEQERMAMQGAGLIH